jgi:hypothetical protein
MNNCLSCGKPVKNKFCNTSCLNRYYNKTRIKGTRGYDKIIITKFGELKKFIVICEKCKKEFEIIEREKLYPQRKKYFCSRSCANSRIFTEESNKRRREKLVKETENKWKEPHIKICKKCKKEFKTRNKKQRFCSQICARRNNSEISSNKIRNNKNFAKLVSIGRKNAFKNGILKITGGTTKWFEYKDIKVQGTYELRTCFILDKWKEQGKIKDWEYTNDRIKYIGIDNKEHSYLLDFKVFENDNIFYYIETKGYKKDNDELKWKATRDKGYKLEVWFDDDIKEKE